MMNTPPMARVRSIYDIHSLPTVKTCEVLPCNQYAGVVVTCNEGAFRGTIISHLTLEDYCLLRGYRLWVKGTHSYIVSEAKVKITLAPNRLLRSLNSHNWR